MSQRARQYVLSLGLDRITRTQKNILRVIADAYSERYGSASFPNADICEATLLGERQVARVLLALSEQGILEYRPGRGVGNYSAFTFPEMLAASGQKEVEKVTETGHKPDGNPTFATRIKEENQNQDQDLDQKQPSPTPPAPQEGRSFHLRSRDHQRIAAWLDRATRPSEARLGGEYAMPTWQELIRSACDFCLLSYDAAVHDLLIMDRDLWEPRLVLKKEPQRVAG